MGEEKSFISGLAEGGITQAANSAIGMGLGLAMEKHNDRRQLRQQEKLQNLQIQGQQAMGQFNYDLQKKMWDETNYGAQMAHLKAAGLNPALLYGKGGAGGQLGAASAGGVSGGMAPSGGGEAVAQMGMGLQAQLLMAQKENIEANTRKTNAEAANQPLVGANLQADVRLKGLQAALESATQSDKIDIVENYKDQAVQDLFRKEKEGGIIASTWEKQIDIINAELVGAVLQNEKIVSDIEVNKATITKWVAEVGQGWKRLSLEERNVKINELVGEFNTSLSREALGAIGGLINTILHTGGKKAPGGITINNNQ